MSPTAVNKLQPELKISLPLQPPASAGTPHLVLSQMYRKGNPEKVKTTLDPILADGWLNALVEDGLVFTADKVLYALACHWHVMTHSSSGIDEMLPHAHRLVRLFATELKKQRPPRPQ